MDNNKKQQILSKIKGVSYLDGILINLFSVIPMCLVAIPLIFSLFNLDYNKLTGNESLILTAFMGVLLLAIETIFISSHIKASVISFCIKLVDDEHRPSLFTEAGDIFSHHYLKILGWSLLFYLFSAITTAIENKIDSTIISILFTILLRPSLFVLIDYMTTNYASLKESIITAYSTFFINIFDYVWFFFATFGPSIILICLVSAVIAATISLSLCIVFTLIFFSALTAKICCFTVLCYQAYKYPDELCSTGDSNVGDSESVLINE